VAPASADGKRRRNEGRARKPSADVRPTQQPLGLEVGNAGEQEKRNEGMG
jgi:hypothetical protein